MTTNRTRGNLTLTDHRAYGFSIDLHSDAEDTFLATVEANDPNDTIALADAQHIVDCWNAVEAIGGDPGTVAELVEMVEKLLTICRDLDDTLGGRTPYDYDYDAAQALLAKAKP